jgi:multidrug efflux pump subunit AcrA (membrane-fusion protein)
MIIALGAACGGAPGPREAETAAATAVQVGTADTRDLAESIVAGGTVKARTVAVLTSRIVGQVREIAARPGDRVRPGAVLAVLDGREMDAHQDRAEALLTAAAQGQSAAEADKAAAGAALRLASATHARIAQLRDRKSATPQEFDEAEASLSAAQARASAASAAAAAAGANLAGARSAVEAARISAGYSRIAAPFAGTITERHIDEGAMTMPGTPVVTIEQDGGYQVEVRIDETRAARVDWAQAPRVALSSPESDENVFEGRVVERALALDSAHTIVVKVAVPGSNALRTGMFARVSFSGGTRRALSVPADAILQRGQLDAVFVVTDDKARYRVVEVGRQAGDFVEVRAGLAAGERVVRSVPASLVDGATVRTAGSGK